MNRESAYAALFARIQGIGGWQSSSRDFFSFEESVRPQPAFCFLVHTQIPENTPNLPACWRLPVEIYVYHTFNNPSLFRSTVLNGYIQAIEDALRLQSGERQMGRDAQTTLGGACQRAWISGPVQLYTGIPEAQAVAIVPVDVTII